MEQNHQLADLFWIRFFCKSFSSHQETIWRWLAVLHIWIFWAEHGMFEEVKEVLMENGFQSHLFLVSTGCYGEWNVVPMKMTYQLLNTCIDEMKLCWRHDYKEQSWGLEWEKFDKVMSHYSINQIFILLKHKIDFLCYQYHVTEICAQKLDFFQSVVYVYYYTDMNLKALLPCRVTSAFPWESVFIAKANYLHNTSSQHTQ